MSYPTHVSHVIHGKGGSGPVDRMIAELAERQHGVVGRRQLGQLGLGRGAIEHRLARGQLHPIQRGAYAVGHRSLSREGRWMAAILSTGPAAVLSHRSAGHLWGLLPPSPILPEVTRPTTCRPRADLRLHCAPLPPDEIAIRDRVPTTSVPRTLLDLAAVLEEGRLDRALNEAEVRGFTDKLSIPDLLKRYPRRSGSAKLRTLLGEGAEQRGITRGDLEERFVEILNRTDLPRPQLNADIVVRGRFFEADCLWSEQRVIVELDGRASHGTRRAFEKDRERDRLLLVEGWQVIRVTWRQLRDDASAVIADLRDLLQGRRAPPTL